MDKLEICQTENTRIVSLVVMCRAESLSKRRSSGVSNQ
jgi:hypothetical protein